MTVSLTRVSKGDKGLRADDYNAVLDIAERMSRLQVAGGTMSQGASGMMLQVPDGSEFGVMIGKAAVLSGSYPSFDNDRKIFPVICYVGPVHDTSLPNAALTFSTEQTPVINVYNLAHCWIFNNTYIPIWRCNGQFWTWNNQKRTGSSLASITKGNLGNVSVLSTTISARAKFADTANGKAVSVYHDGTEWVIDAEECP